MAFNATAVPLIAQVERGCPLPRGVQPADPSRITGPTRSTRSEANFAHRGKTDIAWLTYGSGIGLRGAAGTNIDE